VIVRSFRGRVVSAWLIATVAALLVARAVVAPSLDATALLAVDRALLRAGLIVAGAAVPLYFWIWRRFDAPLAQLGALADRVASGEADVRARSRRYDEVGIVSRAIDRMADRLHDELEHARTEETRLRVMLDAMEEPVLVTDRDGLITLSNAAFVRFSGAPPLGRSVLEAIRSGELHDAVQGALAGRAVSVTFEAHGVRESAFSAHLAPLPEGAGVVVVLHDVTELRRVDAVRRDFVANASHELRTPLTAIRGFAETLRDGALEDGPIAKRFVSNIVENAMRLQRLVDDLLELSRSESPDARFELTRVDARAVANKVVSALEGKAVERGVDLAVVPGEPIWVSADERALDQVLMNLVDNGIKYTPRGGSVTVRMKDESDAALLEVSDTGAGIGAAHLRRVFERFYRVDSGRAREQGGTGLGLAIVKHLTQRMNGDVRVESKLNAGSTFIVRLDRA
jgi:two-component system, OmpR family, phosphate regulon sensor histidine kinase PhoR